jgi:hypothetical protein
MTKKFNFKKSLTKPKLQIGSFMDFYLNFLTIMCVKEEQYAIITMVSNEKINR